MSTKNKTTCVQKDLDVCLVSMPYGSLHRPSLGIGVLLSGAKKAGLTAKAMYPTFWFAERIGLNAYIALSERGDVSDLIGEWTFSGAAFPDFKPQHHLYLSTVLDSDHFNISDYRTLFNNEDVDKALWSIRRKATTFVNATAERVLALSPKIVGCSSVFQQTCASLALLRRIKTMDSSIITMLGGANCEGPMGKTISDEFRWVDIVVSGEADLLFPDLCKSLIEAKQKRTKITLPYGAIRQEEDVQSGAPVLRCSAPRAIVIEMDKTPVPEYEDYFATLKSFTYRDRVKPGLLVETSRGCWWGAKSHCTFCGLNGGGMSFRSKSPSRVEKEFAQLRRRYNVAQFEVVDNILDMKYFETLLPRMAPNDDGVSIFYETKSNLKEHHLRILSEAGVRWIQPGIENMDDRVLHLVSKGNSALQNIALLKYSLEYGVRLSWNLLFGVPGERDHWYKEMAAWLPYISHLQPPSHLVRVRYDRFSPYHEHPDEYEIALRANNAYSYVYPLADEKLSNLAYFFEDYHDIGRGDISGEGVGLVKECWMNWYRDFWGDSRSLLFMTDAGTQTIVWDTRPCAVDAVIVLGGISRAIYQLCREPRSSASLLRSLKGSGYGSTTADQLDVCLQRLMRRKILLSINGRFLGLATRRPNASLLGVTEYPGGYTYATTSRATAIT
jgi:magnesium-protoporphyrin IX monomethyl ester (oxidative) cyclase